MNIQSVLYAVCTDYVLCHIHIIKAFFSLKGKWGEMVGVGRGYGGERSWGGEGGEGGKKREKKEKKLPCTSATFWAAGKENKSSDPGCFASGVKTGAGAWVHRVGGSAGRWERGGGSKLANTG